MARILLNVSDEPLLIGIQLALQFLCEQIRKADDDVKRRPKLVAHAGEKLALQPVRPLHFTVPDFKLLICRAELVGELPVYRIDLLFGLLAARDVATIAITREPWADRMGLRLISTGNWLPSLRCANNSSPMPMGRVTGCSA